MRALRTFGLGVLIFSLASVQAAPRQAAFSEANRKKLEDSIATFNRARSVTGFLETTKAGLSEPQFRFILEKVRRGHGPLPHLEMNGNDGYIIRIKSNDMNIRVRFVSVPDGILEVNGHTLELGTNADPSLAWTKIMAALPQMGSNALFNFFLPEAHAFGPVVDGALVVGGIVAGIWYLVTGDPCKDLLIPLNECKSALRQFKNLKAAFPKWPWNGTDAERLVQLKHDGIGMAGAGKPAKSTGCDSSDADCKLRWARIKAGQCTPMWASDAISASRTALGEGVGPLVEPENYYIRASSVWNKVANKVAPKAVCTDYTDLQTCLGGLVEDLHGVCVHPEQDIKHYDKAMGVTPSEATH